MSNNKSAVVLLSGGLDSATALAIAQEQGYTCFALSFRYGQRHTAELEAAKRVAQSFQVIKHHIVDLDDPQKRSDYYSFSFSSKYSFFSFSG